MPNYLMTMGSHTSLGHNSMICMMECQTNFIVSFLKQVRAGDNFRGGCSFCFGLPPLSSEPSRFIILTR
jgi:hypothetical protein